MKATAFLRTNFPSSYFCSDINQLETTGASIYTTVQKFGVSKIKKIKNNV